MDRLDKGLKRIKLWQEECKLVVMFMAAVTSVYVFVSRLMRGGTEGGSVPVKASAGGSMEAPSMSMDMVSGAPLDMGSQGQDWIMIASAIALLIILPMLVLYIFRVLSKHMRTKEPSNS